MKLSVDPMLSFEISAIDVVLLVAVVALLLLFITQKKGAPEFKPPMPIQDRPEILEQPEITEQPTLGELPEDQPSDQAATGFQKCVHHFGYLRNLPKNTPVPDECFGCPKIMRCLFPNEQIQQTH